MTSSSTYSVAVDSGVPEALTYLPPVDGTPLERGLSVFVPLGTKRTHGLILRPSQDAGRSEFKLKPVSALNPERPPLPEPYVAWIEWMANYYIHPVGLVAENCFPPLEREGARATRKGPVVKDFGERQDPPPMTPEQNEVISAVAGRPGFHVHPVHGVTGSGKTEVYLHLLEKVLFEGKQGLVLVPEIALTPQLIDRFSKRFPGQIAVIHSHLSPREKTNQWWSIVNREKKILIGARSALFCPVPDLGLIVIDEEHEPSYKQDESLRYHARDSAIVLARLLKIPIVLGSATPSLESWHNAQTGRYQLHSMTERVNARALPQIEVVDLREEFAKRKETLTTLPFWLSDDLHGKLVETFAKKEQAALFLNRRGVAQTAQCPACGFAAECPNCSVSLTLHGRSHLVCPYCDYSERLNETCGNCKEAAMMPLGLGTEKIEADMAALFPELRIARADRDEVQTREQLEQLIGDMERREIDLLIGTQMIAKGLDFPHLNLVGLVLADVGFHWPDFRASERSFQLLTQVSGRSGRESAGRVVIQTYSPEHVSVRHSLRHDFSGFTAAELLERQELNYPPFWRLVMFRIQGNHPERAQKTARGLVNRAYALQEQQPVFAENLQILGPAEAPLFKLRGKFRYQVLVKCASAQTLNRFCRQIMSHQDWIETATKVQIDIDPIQMI
jgi:primosomal protein N' (replication factor Y)